MEEERLKEKEAMLKMKALANKGVEVKKDYAARKVELQQAIAKCEAELVLTQGREKQLKEELLQQQVRNSDLTQRVRLIEDALTQKDSAIEQMET